MERVKIKDENEERTRENENVEEMKRNEEIRR